MKITERELWFFLDLMATRKSARPTNDDAADAFAACLKFLETPTPGECAQMCRCGYTVTRPSGLEV